MSELGNDLLKIHKERVQGVRRRNSALYKQIVNEPYDLEAVNYDIVEPEEPEIIPIPSNEDVRRLAIRNYRLINRRNIPISKNDGSVFLSFTKEAEYQRERNKASACLKKVNKDYRNTHEDTSDLLSALEDQIVGDF